jgi:hypothetical protein
MKRKLYVILFLICIVAIASIAFGFEGLYNSTSVGQPLSPSDSPAFKVITATDGIVTPAITAPAASLVIAIVGGQSVKKTNVSDAAYGTSALTADYLIAWTALTAARTATISTEDIESGTATQPRVMIFKDESGNAGIYPITIVLENAGTIDGQAAYSINQAYGSVTIYLNGTSGFCY